jgi:uncharacterized membrane protein SpoIIM required for sporulation
MKDLQLKSQRFRSEREADWRRLEVLLAKAEGGRPQRLTDEELLEIPVLYRAVLSSLSVARATSLDASLSAYLEGLSTRAYFFVYGPRTSLRQRFASFFRSDWPASVQALWRETLVSAVIFLLATLTAYLLVRHDADWYYSMVPGGLTQGRDPTASTAFLRHTLYSTSKENTGLSALATFLFTNNARVSILCFALGFAFCVPTAWFVAQQGFMLGAFFALYASRGLGFQLGGWLFIHGATELFALVLSGAAGFRIGWAVAFPGGRSRVEAASIAGRTAATAMAGVVIMLIFAGLLEGFARQLITLDWARYAIAITTLSLWLAYFYLPRKARLA